MKDFLKNKLREGYNNIQDEETNNFHIDIEKSTLDNDNYRKVLYTTDEMQLVLMSIKPNEEIGEETHPKISQFLRFESGEGKVIMGDVEKAVSDGDSVIIPSGVKHNVINTSNSEPLKLYSIYTPPQHPENTIESDKSEENA